MFQKDADDAVSSASGIEHPQFGARDIGWEALGPAIACVAISTCVVALRWYTRCRIVRCVGWDDYVILLSLLLAWTMLALIASAIHHGIGLVPSDPITIAIQTSTITKLVIANNDVWALCVNITKASIIMQYLRIFSSRLTRAACYILLVALLPAALWAVLGGTLLCNPVAKLWDPALPGHCVSPQTYWLSVAGIDIGLDFLVLLSPLPAISSLHLPRKQKLTLVLVFTLGFFVCAVSLSRLGTVVSAANEGKFVKSGIWAIIWSVVEANVGIICACLLALRPLIGRIWPDLVDETGVPKHCMRLPHLPTTETMTMEPGAPPCLPRSASATTLVDPASPASNVSRGSSYPKRLSVQAAAGVSPVSARRIDEADELRLGIPAPDVRPCLQLSISAITLANAASPMPPPSRGASYAKRRSVPAAASASPKSARPVARPGVQSGAAAPKRPQQPREAEETHEENDYRVRCCQPSHDHYDWGYILAGDLC